MGPSTELDRLVSTHLDAWNAPPGPGRAAALAAAYTDDVLVGEPEGTDHGHAGMERAISALQAHVPGTTLSRRGPIQRAQAMVTYAWALGPSPDAPVATGRDVLLLRDGRISRLYVVIDES